MADKAKSIEDLTAELEAAKNEAAAHKAAAEAAAEAAKNAEKAIEAEKENSAAVVKRLEDMTGSLLTQEELLAENESLRKKAEALENAVKNAKTSGKVSEPVPGSYDVEWKNPQTGKKMTRKVEFKDGRLRSVLPKMAGMEQLAGMYVANESLLLIANGEKAKPEHLEQNPALHQLDQEKAAAVLLHFAAIDAGFLK